MIEEKIINIPCKNGYTSTIFVTKKPLRNDDAMFVISGTGISEFVLSIKKSDHRWDFDDLFDNAESERELVKDILLQGYIRIEGYNDVYYFVPGIYDSVNNKLIREGHISKFVIEKDNTYYNPNLSMWDEFCSRYRVNKNSFYIEAMDTDVIVKRYKNLVKINLNANEYIADETSDKIVPIHRTPTKHQLKILKFIMANINTFEVIKE